MLGLGLSRAEERAYVKSLSRHQSVSVVVQILDLDEEVVQTVEHVLGGQVNCAADGKQTRVLAGLKLYARGDFAFEADGDWDGALHFNRMVRVRYDVKSPGAEKVLCPVFTGPVTGFNRSDNYITVEAVGKEHYAQGQVQRPFTIKKGTPVVDAIRQILRQEAGEDKFSFPDLSARLPRAESLSRDSVPWDVCLKLARSINRQLFYDATGRCRLRAHPRNPVFVFTDGDDGTILTEPEITPRLFDGFANRVKVRGHEKKQARNRDAAAPAPARKDKPDPVVHKMATADRAHPMSPWKLGRNDGTLFYDLIEDNPQIRTGALCQEVADRLLAERLAQSVEPQFSSVVVPHLDVGDPFRYHTRAGGGGGMMREFSIPLEIGQPMTVGARRRVSKSQRTVTSGPVRGRRR